MSNKWKMNANKCLWFLLSGIENREWFKVVTLSIY